MEAKKTEGEIMLVIVKSVIKGYANANLDAYCQVQIHFFESNQADDTEARTNYPCELEKQDTDWRRAVHVPPHRKARQ
jgi:hypothetical protein